jgi:DNA helicase HerA-like ATPase
LFDKIEQVVRLIRSKTVGVYFVTQSPTDIPENILGQLGNRVQHALRAYTPKDQKAVRTAAQTFRANPAFKTEDAIMELGTGEALVSFLDEKGIPSMVQRARILFPLSQIGAISESQRKQCINASRLYGKYDRVIDRESAFEVLLAQSEKEQAQIQAAAQEKESEQRKAKETKAEKPAKEKKSKGLGSKIFAAAVGAAIASVSRSVGTSVANKITGKKTKTKTDGKSIANKAIGNATSTATRTLTRSILGNLLK